jgi:hypothetical protein
MDRLAIGVDEAIISTHAVRPAARLRQAPATY